MNFKSRILLALLWMLLLGFSISFAEDLHVIRGESIDIDRISALDGVNVYAFLDDGLLVGADEEAMANLREVEPAVDTVESIGERAEGSYYFIFHIRRQDLGRLAPGIDVVYSSGNEAVARVAEGEEFNHRSLRLVKGLTRISFVPRLPGKWGVSMPVYEPGVDPDIQAIVDQVSQSRYTAYIQRLQDFVTRYSYTDSCRAAEQWAFDTFAGFGLETELFPYGYSGNTWYDAIGRKIGTLYPDSIYMIIAHIDDTSENPFNSAPGAEDNGSGSACVLEAARVLSQYDFDCTIEFVLVSGEEQGVIGSEAYATYCFTEGRNIGGVFNFDMISYAGSYGWDTNIYSDQYFPAEVALADLLGQLTDLYSNAYSIRLNTSGPTYGSDHYYFSFYGYPAPFSIDAQLWNAPDFYPWYHTTDDVISHLDLDFGTEVVKGGVATLATVANLSIPPLLEFSYPDGLPDLIDPNGGTAFRVEVTAGTSDPEPGTGLLYYSTGGDFASIPMEVVGPNVYDAVFPAVECGVDVSFYVSAETVEGTVVTDPPAAPSRAYSGFSATNIVVLFEDDFEKDLGWTVVNKCSDGQWERGVPVDGEYRGDPPTDYDGSGKCYLTDNEEGNSDVDDGYTYLISPALDLSGVDAVIQYALWYTNNFGNDPYNDLFKVWVSNDNGSNWTNVETFGPITVGGWTEHSFVVSDFVAPTSQVKVRYEASDLDQGSVVEAGVDAFKVVVIECGEPPEVSVSIIPDDPPVEVPPGGSFTFTGTLTNNSSEEAITDVWIMVDVPGYGMFGPVMQLDDLRLLAGQVVTRPGLRQEIPLLAPPGLYTYIAYTGYFPSIPADSSSFEFTVTSGVGSRSVDRGLLEGFGEEVFDRDTGYSPRD